MGRKRTTDRGLPRETTSGIPFTIDTMRDLLRDKVFEPGYRPLEDPVMVFIITRLMHFVNVLQHKAQFRQSEVGISLEMQRRDWQDWVTTGVPPSQRPSPLQLDPTKRLNPTESGLDERPIAEWRSHGSSGLQLHAGGSFVLAERLPWTTPRLVEVSVTPEQRAELEQSPAYVTPPRQHVLDLLSGKVPGNRYCIWLAKEGRDPLLARPIRLWTDYAPDLEQIFRSEPWPDPPKDFDSIVYRFIMEAIPAITGETKTFNAVSTELREERWRMRARV